MNIPSVNFWMFPLCTRVTFRRFCSIAYRIAARMSRSEPSIEIGLMPIDEVFGNRIFFTPMSRVRKSTTFWHSGVPVSHSTPA